MSTVDATQYAQEFALGVVPLLREYTSKLTAISDEAHRLFEEAQKLDKREMSLKILRRDFSSLRDFFQSLRAPAEDLARHVSQMIEHGALEDLSKLELRLRLVEFERTIAALNSLLLTIPVQLTA